MIRVCRICSKIIKIAKSRTVSMDPAVCSMSCFRELLRTEHPNSYNILELPEMHPVVPVTGFRSEFEEMFVNDLLKHRITSMYEPYAFVGSGCLRAYIPDIYLPIHNVFLELKGRWASSDKTKVRLFESFCRQNNVGFFTLDQSQYRMWDRCMKK